LEVVNGYIYAVRSELRRIADLFPPAAGSRAAVDDLKTALRGIIGKDYDRKAKRKITEEDLTALLSGPGVSADAALKVFKRLNITKGQAGQIADVVKALQTKHKLLAPAEAEYGVP